jgi:tetratricopeptide (TPR) repeat protein
MKLETFPARMDASFRWAYRSCRRSYFAFVLLALAQQAIAQYPSVQVVGTVKSPDGAQLAGVVVQLRTLSAGTKAEAITDADGRFVFPHVIAGDYSIDAATRAMQGTAETVHVGVDKPPASIQILLHPATAGGAGQQMEFSDEPTYTVAGVTDWTAVGGHGADSTLRTTEALATATATLQPGDSSRGHATTEDLKAEDKVRAYERTNDNAKAREWVHDALQHHESATLYRLAGEVDEKASDPLAAVHEFERAAKLDPSEENEFEWGSELLVHRAIWQAEEVFQDGAKAYPQSVRMQTALGTALFAGARYEQAAASLCKASDLAPADGEPYHFMGKVELAAPDALACIEQHLARYVQLQPQSSEANYLYAMAILKRQQHTPDERAVAQAEALLNKAVEIDEKCSEGYFELGVLAAQKNNLQTAVHDYTKAIDADPAMADAYYRLAKAYERIGESEKAKAAFALHDKVQQQQAEATEQQRRAIKQFLFAKPGDAPMLTTP